jgi:Tol biopolymer transport system component
MGTADFQLLRKADGEVLGWPAWSPDGTRLAYGVTSLQARSGGKEERSDLETCDLLGNRTVVDEGIPLDTYEEVTGLCWLPDGRLVHSRWNDPSLSSGEFWTVGVNPKSGEVKEPPRRLFGIEGGTLRSPTASADGKRLAFTCMRQHRRLWLMELGESGPGGPELRRLTVADWPAEAGVWSRDGQKFLFQSVRRSMQNDIFVLDLKTNREEPLVADSRNELPQCLTPDGSHLLYWRGSDPMELMAIPVTGGEAKRLGERDGNMPPALRCGEGPGSPCISAELQESELVLARLGLDGRGEEEILRIDLATESDRFVAGTELWNVGFDLSADGKRAVVTEFGGRIRIIDVESCEIQELPRMWDGWTQSVSWSRDAAWLYVSGMEGGFKYWLRRFNLRGESEILWKSNEMWAHGPVPSPDGRSVVFEGIEREADVWLIEDF